MSFAVGDYVHHYRMPHIWRITVLNDISAYEDDSAARLDLVWKPGWWPNSEGYQNPNCRLANAIQRGAEVVCRDLRPANEMLVIAVAAQG